MAVVMERSPAPVEDVISMKALMMMVQMMIVRGVTGFQGHLFVVLMVAPTAHSVMQSPVLDTLRLTSSEVHAHNV